MLDLVAMLPTLYSHLLTAHCSLLTAHCSLLTAHRNQIRQLFDDAIAHAPCVVSHSIYVIRHTSTIRLLQSRMGETGQTLQP